MNSGELHAWHYGTRLPIRLTWRSGQIVSIEDALEKPTSNVWIAPPLFDLQINGYAGVDFQQDGVTGQEILRAVRALRRDACTRFFLTLITDEWERMTARLRHYCGLRHEHPEIAAAVVGFHLEGPFLSPEPGFCGAHDPMKMIAATPAHLAQARAMAGSVPLLLTVAPECPGVDRLVESAFSDPATFINAGHTNAPSSKLLLRSRGHPAFTHLANGCPQLLDRHDNIIWRALNLDPLWISLIPDGQHVSGDLFRIIHRLKGDRIYYTTDAMSAAGAPVPGRYRLGTLHLEIKEDGIARFPGGTNFAGSALTPIAGVFRAAEMLNCDWQDCWKLFSDTPARRINVDESLAPGNPADFCTLEFTGLRSQKPDQALRLQTWVAGTPHAPHDLTDPKAVGNL